MKYLQKIMQLIFETILQVPVRYRLLPVVLEYYAYDFPLSYTKEAFKMSVLVL